MCGFAGWAGVGRHSPQRVLPAMGRYLAARGPDEEILLERPGFHIVFRRLAIVDVAGGHQPFVSPDGRLVVAVNGEIYNHRDLARRYLSGTTFATASDCEVVLHLFAKLGVSFLAHLNGIFAIAIWNTAERRLLLARDHLGVKPLYYTHDSNRVIFASELKALLAHPDAPRTIDWAAFDHVPGSAFPFDRPAGRAVATGVKHVDFVEPASWIEWCDGELTGPARYWHPGGPSGEETARSADDYVDEYFDLISSSVRFQLMSDVPVGVSLSGGLDSALITALAARQSDALTAFTLAEPSISATGDTDAAIQLAQSIGVPLHLVRVDHESLSSTVGLDLATLEYFVWLMDFPLFDVEFLFKHELHRYATHVVKALKVMLIGQGADEFAGGYSRLGPNNWQAFASREAAVLHLATLKELGIPSPYRAYVNGIAATTQTQDRVGTHEPWQYLRFGDLAAYNLWHEDRTAAANGIEARVPFLDYRLVEFLCSVPASRRAELFYNKNIVRRAAERVLPSGLARRPKIPLFMRAAGAHDSVGRLYRRLIDTAFPDYCDKYLSNSGLFSRSALFDLRDQAMTPRIGEAACHLLLRCMAIDIFSEHCRRAAAETFTVPASGNALPVRATAAPVAPSAVWSADSRIQLAGSVRVAIACEEPPALLVIVDGAVAARVGVPSEALGHLPSVFAGRSFGVGELANGFGGNLDDVLPLAEAFVNRGWGVLSGEDH